MTEREENIYSRLQERSPAIAAFYASGLKLLADETFPARAYYIAHACREIRNALPDIYGVESNPELKISLIANRWTDSVSGLVAKMADVPTEPIPIPRDVAEDIHRMVLADKDVDGKLRRRFGAMCDLINPSTLRGFTDPSLATTWAQARPDALAHVSRKPFTEPRDASAAIVVFRRIENVLAALYATADSAVPLLEDFIREANER